jgi:3-hydroxyisobutyrate dehydrogenase
MLGGQEKAMSEKIGFIGLGIMGRGMTHNLLKAGHTVTVWNRTAARMDEFVAAGATAAASPAEIGATCDIIMICVSDSADVAQVITGDHGLLETISTGKLVIDHSTISPQTTRELAALLNAKGAHMLDAPISGGSEGAANGT